MEFTFAGKGVEPEEGAALVAEFLHRFDTYPDLHFLELHSYQGWGATFTGKGGYGVSAIFAVRRKRRIEVPQLRLSLPANIIVLVPAGEGLGHRLLDHTNLTKLSLALFAKFMVATRVAEQG